MHAVLRSPHGVPCGMRASGNPGGCGHGWVKERYIDPVAPLVKQDVMYEGMSAPKSRVYIPSKLENNKYLGREYADALYLSGNRQLVRAWLEGEWDIVAGAAFDIRRDRHQLRPFRPLQHWRKWMVMDWGYVRPFSVGWYCMPDEDVVLAALGDWKEKLIPRGSIVRYREYYGWGGKANEGARLEAPDVADEIVRIEEMANEVMDYRIGDTGMWARVDGPSVAERMAEGGVVVKGVTKSELAQRFGDAGEKAMDKMETLIDSLDENIAYKASSFVLEQVNGKARQKIEEVRSVNVFVMPPDKLSMEEWERKAMEYAGKERE